MKFFLRLLSRLMGHRRFCMAVLLAFSGGALLLSACGGGSSNSAGGVGTGGSGVVEGVVSGLGSVIVNGVEYDNSSASMTTDDALGTSSNVEVAVGQRVRLILSNASSASAVVVLPQLVGPLQSAPGSTGEFRALGQTVRLAGSGADKGNNPAAVLAGFTSGSPQAGDEVEIHGTWVLDHASQSYVLLASRLEKRSVASDPVLVSGIVQSLNTVAGTLRLNTASGTQISATALPQGLSQGDWVRVWVARTALSGLASNQTLKALRIANMALSATSVGASNGDAVTVTLSGPASAYDAAAGTFQIQGKTVKLPVGAVVDATALASGALVQITLRVSSGSDGSSQWAMQSVLQDDANGGGNTSANNLGRTTTIKAITNGLDWSDEPVLLRLRGQAISAARSVVAPACLSAASDQSLLVEVRGSRFTGSTLVASKVTCSNAYGSGTGDTTKTIEQSGTVLSVNPGSDVSTGTLVLQIGKSTRLNVAWNARSFLASDLGSPSQWVGASLEIEGALQNGVLIAQSMRKRG